MHSSKISQVHSYLGNFVFLVACLVRQNLKTVLAKEIANCCSQGTGIHSLRSEVISIFLKPLYNILIIEIEGKGTPQSLLSDV